MRKGRLVTSGEDRLPAGTAEELRTFCDFRAQRCETPEALLATFPDAEVLWMFGPNLCLKTEALEEMPDETLLAVEATSLQHIADHEIDERAHE